MKLGDLLNAGKNLAEARAESERLREGLIAVRTRATLEQGSKRRKGTVLKEIVDEADKVLRG